MYHKVANISRLFTNFTFTDVACEKDADEDVFYQILHFKHKMCLYLNSFTGQLYAACDATSYNINNLFVSLKCQNDRYKSPFCNTKESDCIDAEVASLPEKWWSCDVPLSWTNTFYVHIFDSFSCRTKQKKSTCSQQVVVFYKKVPPKKDHLQTLSNLKCYSSN